MFYKILDNIVSIRQFELDSNYFVIKSNNKSQKFFLVEKQNIKSCVVNENESINSSRPYKYDELLEIFKDYQKLKIGNESFSSFEKRTIK